MARALHLIQELNFGEITSSAFDCSAGAPREGKRFTASLSRINAMQNVSGGFGMFDREIVIKAGGYDGDSFAEDMDMVARMIRYMCDSGEDYRIVQIPETCCWTEGPPNLQVLNRQRTRWGRGLLQFFTVHRDMIGNKNYRQFGFVTLPYIMIFELLAPVIEATGYITLLYLFIHNAINYHTIWIVFVALYSFAQLVYGNIPVSTSPVEKESMEADSFSSVREVRVFSFFSERSRTSSTRYPFLGKGSI